MPTKYCYYTTHALIIIPSGSMGFGGPGRAASATIALASSLEIRLGLPVTVVLALCEGVKAQEYKLILPFDVIKLTLAFP